MHGFHWAKMDSRCVHFSNRNLDKHRDIFLFHVSAANNVVTGEDILATHS